MLSRITPRHGFACRNILQLSKSFCTNGGEQLPNDVDVIVIGGGSIGCSTLYHLTRRGVKNAILLEKHKITSGTTWHTAGLLWRLRPYDVEIMLIDRTWRLNMGILNEETGMDTGFINNGGLFVASTKERLDEYKRLMTLGKVYGIESHVLSPAETKKLYPIMNVDDVYGCLYSPQDGLVDPTGWCQALCKGATMSGAKVYEHTPVTKLITEVDDFGVNRIRGVETPSGTIKASKVILTAGSWAPKLAKTVGVHLPSVTMKHAYVNTDRIGDIVRNTPNVRDHDSSFYVRLSGDALALGGYEPNPNMWEDVQDDFHFGLFDLDMNHFAQHIEGGGHRIPALLEAGIKSTVCGPMSFTPDHRPMMGESLEVRDFFLGSCMDVGMMCGGGFGDQLAAWVVDGRPELHMYKYDIRRFHPMQARDYRWTKERCHENHVSMYRTAFPNDEFTSGRNMRLTPFHKYMAKAGAVFQERHGWERPGWFRGEGLAVDVPPYDWYGAYPDTKLNENNVYADMVRQEYTFDFPKHQTNIENECLACRSNVAVFDMSYFGKYYITGPDAQKAVDYIFCSDLRKDVGVTVYTCMLNQRGGVESDLTVSVVESGRGSPVDPQFGEDGERGFYVAAGGASATHAKKHMETIIQDQKYNVKMTEVTDGAGVLSVQGRNSRALLQGLVDIDLSNDSFPFSCNRVASIAGCKIRLLRLSFVGELGFELHVPTESCEVVYEALWDAGKQYGLINAGYRAIDSLSIEKGYRSWDADLRSDDSPLEAGLAFTCKLKTDIDFMGRTALESEKKAGLKKRLVSVTLDEKVPLWSLEAIKRNGEPVGFVRRADYTYDLKKSIGYGYVSNKHGPTTPKYIREGTYSIEAMGIEFPVSVSLKSEFDPNSKRLLGDYS